MRQAAKLGVLALSFVPLFCVLLWSGVRSFNDGRIAALEPDEERSPSTSSPTPTIQTDPRLQAGKGGSRSRSDPNAALRRVLEDQDEAVDMFERGARVALEVDPRLVNEPSSVCMPIELIAHYDAPPIESGEVIIRFEYATGGYSTNVTLKDHSIAHGVGSVSDVLPLITGAKERDFGPTLTLRAYMMFRARYAEYTIVTLDTIHLEASEYLESGSARCARLDADG